MKLSHISQPMEKLRRALAERPSDYASDPENWDYNEGEPSWQWMTPIREVNNEPLIHFTNDGQQILQNGFRGTPNANKLAWTIGLEKKTGGYNFAFLANSDEVKKWIAHGSYGSDIILFNADGLLIKHEGDQEEQVVFWGPSVQTNKMRLITPDPKTGRYQFSH